MGPLIAPTPEQPLHPTGEAGTGGPAAWSSGPCWAPGASSSWSPDQGPWQQPGVGSADTWASTAQRPDVRFPFGSLGGGSLMPPLDPAFGGCPSGGGGYGPPVQLNALHPGPHSSTPPGWVAHRPTGAEAARGSSSGPPRSRSRNPGLPQSARYVTRGTDLATFEDLYNEHHNALAIEATTDHDLCSFQQLFPFLHLTENAFPRNSEAHHLLSLIHI